MISDVLDDPVVSNIFMAKNMKAFKKIIKSESMQKSKLKRKGKGNKQNIVPQIKNVIFYLPATLLKFHISYKTHPMLI